MMHRSIEKDIDWTQRKIDARKNDVRLVSWHQPDGELCCRVGCLCENVSAVAVRQWYSTTYGWTRVGYCERCIVDVF